MTVHTSPSPGSPAEARNWNCSRQVASNTDPDETTLSIPVRTITGYVDVSREAIERGQLVEQMLLSDLEADHNSRLDAQVIAGSGNLHRRQPDAG